MPATRTVRQIIDFALGVIGEFSPGEATSGADAKRGLQALQDLLAEWGDGGLVVPSIVLEAITLVANQESYTVGESGSAQDLDTVRPEQITGAFVRDGSDYDFPVRIIGEKAYRLLRIKSANPTDHPDRLWYNPTTPNGTVYVHPPPSSTYALWISSTKPFIEPTKLTENLLNTTEIPRNYHNALKWNLAIELAPEYGQEVTPVIAARAADTYDKIISLNAARRVQAVGFEVGDRFDGRRFNILSD